MHTDKFETYLNELLQKVPLTTEILLCNAQPEKEIDNRWIDWANQMLKAGYISDNLLEFSKLSPEADNQISLIGLANVILDELIIDSIPIEDILKFHAINIAKQAINNEKEIFETLGLLRDLFHDYEYHIFYDFPILWKAYEQLKIHGEQIVWEDKELNFRNKEDYIKGYLRSWIGNSTSKIITTMVKKSPIQRFFSFYGPILILILIFVSIIFIVYYSYQLTHSFVLPIIISVAVANAIILVYTKFSR